MRERLILTPILLGTSLGFALCPAHSKPAAAEGAPRPATLTVGALQIASDAHLQVSGFDINVAGDKVVYSYFFKNNGSTALDLAASISMPELAANAIGSEIWALPSHNPENPVGLRITAGGAPVATKAQVEAYALHINRLTELKAEHLPLIPFSAEAKKALAALSPQSADRLSALGLVSPRDASQPDTPLTAAWALDVAQTWLQNLQPGKLTPVVVTFSPVKAVYRMVKGDEEDVTDMEQDICLAPQTLSALQARLTSGGARQVSDLTLDIEGPAGCFDTPAATLNVQKPKPESVVAFCGMDEKTAKQPNVLGRVPEQLAGTELRIVIFTPVEK